LSGGKYSFPADVFSLALTFWSILIADIRLAIVGKLDPAIAPSGFAYETFTTDPTALHGLVKFSLEEKKLDATWFPLLREMLRQIPEQRSSLETIAIALT